MEYSPFEIPSPTESVDVELTHEDMIEGGTTTEPGIVQRVSSLARQALSQVRSTTRRVRAETERLVEGRAITVGRSPAGKPPEGR